MTGKKILIVDDVELIGIAFQTLLGADGHKVDVAISGDEALKLAKKTDYDIVFLDLLMPGMSGAETYSRLKEIQPHNIVIFITGQTSEEVNLDDISLKENGGSSYILRKPFGEKEIRGILKQALEEKGR